MLRFLTAAFVLFTVIAFTALAQSSQESTKHDTPVTAERQIEPPLVDVRTAFQPPLAATGNKIGGYLDLVAGTFTKLDPAVKLASAVVDSDTDGFYEGVLRIDLNPATTSFTRVCFILIYEGEPTGITLNIGDSATNDGGGGDFGTQSHDAEMQIQDDLLSVFSSDPYGAKMHDCKVNLKDGALKVCVSDMFLSWGNSQHSLDFASGPDLLYALDGQADLEGPINYDLYAGFNRVVFGPGSRIGAGLSKVLVTLE